MKTCLFILLIISLGGLTTAQALGNILESTAPDSPSVSDKVQNTSETNTWPPQNPTDALQPKYSFGFISTYPVMIGGAAAVEFNERMFFKFGVGPSIKLALNHEVRASTIVDENLIDGISSIALSYQRFVIPLKISYSRMLNVDFGYYINKKFFLSTGLVYRRIELSGKSLVPLFATLKVANIPTVAVDLHTTISSTFQSTLDQLDLRLGGGWRKEITSSVFVEFTGGIWTPLLRIISPKSRVDINTKIPYEIANKTIDLAEFIEPHLSEVESKINQGLINESLNNRLILPLYFGLFIGRAF